MLPSLCQNTTSLQEGALLQYVLGLRQLLDEKLANSWIRREDPTSWPACSASLNPIDCFLRTNIKNKVYQTLCLNLRQLMERITSAIMSVTADMLDISRKTNRRC